MQIILALVVGAAIGLGLHFLVEGRPTRGLVVAPVTGALAAGLAWTIMTWAGIGTDSIWLWLSMLVAPVILVYPVLVALARTRVARDAAERARLKIG